MMHPDDEAFVREKLFVQPMDRDIEMRARECLAQTMEQFGGDAKLSCAADIRGDVGNEYWDVPIRAMISFAALSASPLPGREEIALALVNEARRFSGFSLYASLSELEPHRYRDQLRYADAILSLSTPPTEG